MHTKVYRGTLRLLVEGVEFLQNLSVPIGDSSKPHGFRFAQSYTYRFHAIPPLLSFRAQREILSVALPLLCRACLRVELSARSLSHEMKPAVDVEQLAGHEIAFGRGQKEHGADQVVFHLRALDAALIALSFRAKRGIFLDANTERMLN